MRILLLLIALLLPVSVRASDLSVAAAALAPGQWVPLPTTNSALFLLSPTQNYSLFEWANKGTWDVVGQKAYFCGASHPGNFFNACITYNAATNAWAQMALPPTICNDWQDFRWPGGANSGDGLNGCSNSGSEGTSFVHAYDHNALDTSRRIFMMRNQQTIQRYDIQTASWLSAATLPDSCGSGASIAMAMEYLANTDKVYYFDGQCNYPYNYAIYTPGSGTALGTVTYDSTRGAFPNSDGNIVATYSKQGFVYAGGGGSTPTTLVRQGATGGTTNYTSPVNIGQTGGNLIADPASGRVLWFQDASQGGTPRIYELNTCPTKPCSTATPTWTNTGIESKSWTTQGGSIVIGMPDHGVIMFARVTGTGTTDVWLYKQKTLADGDWIARTDLPGTIYANGFDSAGDLGTLGWGNRVGYGCSTNCPTITTGTKASGAGSLLFTIPNGGNGAAAGDFWANWSTDLSAQYGAGQTFYTQHRTRYSQTLIDAGNFKSHWIATAGDKPTCNTGTATGGGPCRSSCSELELVAQTTSYWYKYPTYYSGCPSGNTGQVGFQVAYGGSDFKNQNERASPFCLYSQTIAGTQFPPTGNCFGYFANEWMTHGARVTVGARGSSGASTCGGSSNLTNCFYGSNLMMRMGREGQAMEDVQSWTGVIGAGTVADDEKFGKSWFIPYSGNEVFPSGGTLQIDELIISTQPIADPGASGSPSGGGGPTSYAQSVNDSVGFFESESPRTFGRGRLRNKINRKLI